MSTNDDSASRRGRRPEAGSQQWRAQNGQDREDRRFQSSPRDRDIEADPYFDPRARNQEAPQSDPRRNAYSAFSRHSPPPRQEPPPPPPLPQQHREPPRFFAEQAPPRNDGGRNFHDAGFSPYEHEAPALPYPEADRDDLFGGREPATLNYAHRGDAYEQPARPSQREAVGRADEASYMARDAGSPIDDYERNFAARIAAQENQASRFFLPEESAPQRPMPQSAHDDGYMAQGHYAAGGFQPQPASPAARYGQDAYQAADNWGGDFHEGEGEIHSGLPQRVSHGDELDEDFFADEDELYHDEDYSHQKKGRKKLIAAALIGAIGVGGGGMYAYKHVFKSGSGSPTLIRADSRPSKEAPSNPGGKQFANGEKLIYDRILPNGETQSASLGSAEAAIPPAKNPAPSTPVVGNSLEDRIEEALKKAQKSGDAPPTRGQAAAFNNQPSSGRSDQPTVVHGETYRSDGTMVDGGRPMVTPSIASVNSGQLPPPFGNATPVSNSPFTSQVQAAPLPSAPFRAPPAQQMASARSMQQPASPQPAQTKLALATPAAPASGYYVQLKSSQDEKAAAREMQSLNDKFSTVLSGAQLITKTVDLGDKGVWFRTMAGPLTSKEAAGDLCTKLKGAGLSGCLVQKSE